MALTSAETAAITEKLSSLTERELIEFMAPVLQAFAKKTGEQDSVSYAMAVVDYWLPNPEDEPFVRLMGLPSDPNRFEPGDDAVESGTCPRCGVVVACTSKLAVCPVCGMRDVECT